MARILMKRKAFRIHSTIQQYVRHCTALIITFIIWFSLSSCSLSKIKNGTSKTIEVFSCTQLCPYKSILTQNRLEFDSNNFIQHNPEFICQANFRNLADWIYGWPNQFNEQIEMTTADGKQIAPCLPHGSIIYVSIWVIGEFFSKVYPNLINNFILITGEGDLSSPYADYLEQSDSKIIHWFGQNGKIDGYLSEKFTHIPIGIQCYEMVEAIHSIYQQNSNDTIHSIDYEIDEPAKYIQPIDRTRKAVNSIDNFDRKHLLLINFNRHTDSTGLRQRIWKDMCKIKDRLPFLSCLSKSAGVNPSSLSNIYRRNREYFFWLSPRGNGIDCHRTWEALYLDVIPIVWNSSLNILYENLPVVIIQNHSDITETFLREKLKEISLKKLNFQSNIYQFEKLRNSYWRRLILSKSRHNLTNIHIRTNACWRGKTIKTR